MAIQIRRGSNSDWESNYSNIVIGEPAITTDSERFLVGIDTGAYAEFTNINTIAFPFATANNYIAGELCVYQGKIYKCINPHSGAWDSSNFIEVNLDEGILSTDDYLELAILMASDYDATATYFEGQFCIYNGNVYEANQDISIAEAWDNGHWNLIGSAS